MAYLGEHGLRVRASDNGEACLCQQQTHPIAIDVLVVNLDRDSVHRQLGGAWALATAVFQIGRLLA